MKGYVTIRQHDSKIKQSLMLSTDNTNKRYEFKLEQIQARHNNRHPLTRWLFENNMEDAIMWAEIHRDDRLDKLDAIVYALQFGDVLISLDDFYFLDLGEIV